ncbi:hypothetical protein I4U23_014443 [Adineta vaga]|nr:hypothetical protein I4U23_014443 [Adineta vaga]
MVIFKRYCVSRACLLLLSLSLTLISYMIVFHHKSSKKFVNEHPVKCSSDYFDLLFDFTCSTATCQLDDVLIIYILSTAHNFDRRNVIRSTWGSPFLGTCFVFILGKSQSPIQQRIEQEKRKYKDIVQINHVESYANVVYKEVGALHWSSHFYPSIPFLFKTDDDLIVDTLLISSIAQILTSNNQRNSS